MKRQHQMLWHFAALKVGFQGFDQRFDVERVVMPGRCGADGRLPAQIQCPFKHLIIDGRCG